MIILRLVWYTLRTGYNTPDRIAPYDYGDFFLLDANPTTSGGQWGDETEYLRGTLTEEFFKEWLIA